MNPAPFAPGVAVIIAPQAYPTVRWRGVITRRARHGWRVAYDAWGVRCTDTFGEARLALAGGESCV